MFFPLPDGTGLLYNVSGSADPPKPAGKIKRDVPSKTTYTEMLTASNWLKKPQRYVHRTVLRPVPAFCKGRLNIEFELNFPIVA